ncbi:hypothetical protein, variant [Verruconis gallopava]|uniref:Uncharacterized protein n=1 Tax=Verruconis gallopava TaxID=253628 RepID=A0A0D1Y1A3_9PEZI|nr:hypothetical protein, variant [Verruconis gallopava]KIW08851.1 hypothetical protein, variant [Verruconis gallopava]
MASGSKSDSHCETVPTRTSIAPPRLPLPPRFQSSQVDTSDARPWSSSDSVHASPHPSGAFPYAGEIRENRSPASRHSQLPPLDTSQLFHRSIPSNQLPAMILDPHSSKRRRIGEPEELGRQPEDHQGFHPQFTRYRLDTLDHARATGQKRTTWDSHANRASGNVVCCSPGCPGSTCSRLRSIVQDLVTEICARDPLVSGGTSSSDVLPPKPILPEATEIDTGDALEWALQRLRWNNASLKNLLNLERVQASDLQNSSFRYTSSIHSPLDRMKRDHETAHNNIESSSPQSSQQFSSQPEPSSQNSVLGQHDSWRALEPMDPPGQPPSRHYRSTSFSNALPMPSPTHSAHTARMLPSPSSMNLSIPPNLPRISSPTPGGVSAAHLAHLQDLQHQVSVKQLALQTLQREYDSLLQKLERQSIKSQALEKKFEVSDAEINALTDEKERLASQVLALEAQVEELQVARDEARKMGADSAAQYMRIVEMANQLQGKGVEDRKQWENERGLLLKRIAELEGNGGPISPSLRSGGGQHSQTPGENASNPRQHLSETTVTTKPLSTESPSPQSKEILSMQKEIIKLKNRIVALQSALKEALEESKAVKAAALTLATAGQRLEATASSVLGDMSKS